MLNVVLITVNILLTNINAHPNYINGVQLPRGGIARRPGSDGADEKTSAVRRNLARHVELTHRTGLTSMSYPEESHNMMQYTQPEVPSLAQHDI